MADILTPERIAKLRHAMPFVDPPDAGKAFMEALDSHEALRAERDRFSELADARHDALCQARRQRDEVAAERDALKAENERLTAVVASVGLSTDSTRCPICLGVHAGPCRGIV